MTKILRIATTVTVCLAIGYFSGMVTRDSITTWFPTLVKPIFNPPNSIFAPVWTLLYIFMGIAAGLVWNQLETNHSKVVDAMKFFVLQLALNAAWSLIFFGLHNTFLALIEIILLLLVIYETYKKFKDINRISGLLFLPYIAWVSFATILNASIWWLNR
jgi:translocator protein